MMCEKLQQSPLGKASSPVSVYTPSLLFAIPRQDKRKDMGINTRPPFHGVDIWNAYEVSWLNLKGKPEVAIAEFFIPADSPNLIEAKSFKLYLHSFNQTRFGSLAEVKELLSKDISQKVGSVVKVSLRRLDDHPCQQRKTFPGICIDSLDIEIKCYAIDATFLQCSPKRVHEEFHSHLLKSNCPVTSQPDWGSIYVHYIGPEIDHASFLRYIISFRQHKEFHEHCIERVFVDIMEQCHPEKLTVFGKYTRRGGIDINPFRSNFETCPPNFWLIRQ